MQKLGEILAPIIKALEDKQKHKNSLCGESCKNQGECTCEGKNDQHRATSTADKHR